ncbi:superoxide dismutase family protein [Streptomyces sp. MST-110588]|uniref:superoxide dismutase family protein n=1 Tax=Streptomyces sp. MST-110588 TaxID=2833628 RepID=UPI001F5DC2A3|nr:superoxide dismutase family protein [Streptomyces sp. MST-110588]UNO42322.1 superoxide dismutase family protein [Streptomyces sp. MST-110588]
MPFATSVTAVLTASLAAVSATAPTTAARCPDVVVGARFVPAPGSGPDTKALTYDPKLVPAGSRVAVVERRHKNGKDDKNAGKGGKGGGTTVVLRLKGLVPDRTYGAHVHTKPCGPQPADSGPHYQNVPDPVQPSTDPAYANPRNEVWLDFTTDEDGDGGAVARVDWHFRAGQARSVVVHEHATETEPGHAGMAGARLACVNVPFV